jgi:hypothetical protein
VAERRTLARAVEDADAAKPVDAADVVFDAPVPTNARFHATPDGSLYALYHLSGGDGAGLYCRELLPDAAAGPAPVRLAHPMTAFFTATERLGTEPSNTVDLYGPDTEPEIMRYARLEIVRG